MKFLSKNQKFREKPAIDDPKDYKISKTPAKIIHFRNKMFCFICELKRGAPGANKEISKYVVVNISQTVSLNQKHKPNARLLEVKRDKLQAI